MRIGRSMKRDPWLSACALSDGPRSTVTAVTIATATTTASVAITRRTMTRVRCVSGCEKAVRREVKVTSDPGTLSDHDEHGLGFDRGALDRPHLADRAGDGRAQLVLHFHRLDHHHWPAAPRPGSPA